VPTYLDLLRVTVETIAKGFGKDYWQAMGLGT
jgi:hypothetical protein